MPETEDFTNDCKFLRPFLISSTSTTLFQFQCMPADSNKLFNSILEYFSPSISTFPTLRSPMNFSNSSSFSLLTISISLLASFCCCFKPVSSHAIDGLLLYSSFAYLKTSPPPSISA